MVSMLFLIFLLLIFQLLFLTAAEYSWLLFF